MCYCWYDGRAGSTFECGRKMRPSTLEFPKIYDVRGSLTFIEGTTMLPFEINRAYWIYDVPGGEIRGGHAFKTQEEVIIALSGSFDVVIKKLNCEQSYSLNRAYQGLYVPCGYWRHMENFSTNTVALVLASSLFSEDDYIRDYDKYEKWFDER